MSIAMLFALIFFGLIAVTFVIAVGVVVASENDWHPLQRVAVWRAKMQGVKIREIPALIARKRRMKRTYMLNQEHRAIMEEIRARKQADRAMAAQAWVTEFKEQMEISQPMLEPVRVEKKRQKKHEHRMVQISDFGGRIVAEYCVDQDCNEGKDWRR